jgi:transposase
MDETSPDGWSRGTPASSSPGCSPALVRRATGPLACPLAPRPRGLRVPGGALDARPDRRRDSGGVWRFLPSCARRPLVPRDPLESPKAGPAGAPARRGCDYPVARGDLASHQKGAQAQGQHLFFIDESGFYPLPSVVRTYAPIGQTPILREWWTRDHLSAISALSPEGKLYFACQDHALNSVDVAAFLEHLLREVPGHMILIWDGAPIHRSQVIKDFLANGAAQRIHLERLPAYAPELNPGEGLWAYLKAVELRNLCCFNLRHLRDELRDAVKRVRRKPRILQGCFQGAGL